MRPFGRVVILIVLGSTLSASGGGRDTPCSGISNEVSEAADPPLNQLKKPGDDELVAATALELA